MMALLTRLPTLSLAQFDSHWHKPHGDPLTLAIPTIRHVVQNVRLLKAEDLSDAGYHGIPEVWFDDLEAALGLQDAPGYAEAQADQVHFMDVAALRFLVMREDAVDGAAGPGDGRGVKLIRLLRRARGTERAAFHAAWSDDTDRARGRAVGAVRHVRADCRPTGDTDGELVFDAVRELWFGDLDALRAGPARSPQAWRELLEPDGTDPAASVNYVAVERRLR
ncbi:EthD domain-containing protein [Streptomyces sp. NPDC048484]|uniref:EthD domain-containing protein n=1 Tax=Streptomyces sp. NPDC048484 TaxID=3155146 RepID=UPI003434C508